MLPHVVDAAAELDNSLESPLGLEVATAGARDVDGPGDAVAEDTGYCAQLERHAEEAFGLVAAAVERDTDAPVVAAAVVAGDSARGRCAEPLVDGEGAVAAVVPGGDDNIG